MDKNTSLITVTCYPGMRNGRQDIGASLKVVLLSPAQRRFYLFTEQHFSTLHKRIIKTRHFQRVLAGFRQSNNLLSFLSEMSY